MYNNHACAAKGERYGSRQGQLLNRSMQRAAVNIYKTDSSFELLVFAPGRIREHFNVQLDGRQLTVSYTPPEGFPRPEWIQREYSRGGFVRQFALNEAIDAAAITAKYVDGVLHISLPLLQQTGESNSTRIAVS